MQKSKSLIFGNIAKYWLATQQKCCRYNQNGQPLPKETVDRIYATLGDLIEGWTLNKERTRLIRNFFTEDYRHGIGFIQEVAKVDFFTTKNCPSVSYQKGEIISLELYSPSLDGLSQVDFELAMNINKIDFTKYYLIPLKDLKSYRREVQAYKMKKQSEQIRQELQQTAIKE